MQNLHPKLLACDFDGYAYEDETNNDTECSVHSKVYLKCWLNPWVCRTTRLHKHPLITFPCLWMTELEELVKQTKFNVFAEQFLECRNTSSSMGKQATWSHWTNYYHFSSWFCSLPNLLVSHLASQSWWFLALSWRGVSSSFWFAPLPANTFVRVKYFYWCTEVWCHHIYHDERSLLMSPWLHSRVRLNFFSIPPRDLLNGN